MNDHCKDHESVHAPKLAAVFSAGVNRTLPRVLQGAPGQHRFSQLSTPFAAQGGQDFGGGAQFGEAAMPERRASMFERSLPLTDALPSFKDPRSNEGRLISAFLYLDLSDCCLLITKVLQKTSKRYFEQRRKIASSIEATGSFVDP